MPSQKTGFLSEIEKEQIIVLRSKNDSFSSIAKHLHRPLSTVKNFYKRYEMRGSTKNCSSSDRPKKIDERTQRRLARASRLNRRQPLSELHNEIVTHTSVRTAKPSLALVNIRKWR